MAPELLRLFPLLSEVSARCRGQRRATHPPKAEVFELLARSARWRSAAGGAAASADAHAATRKLSTGRGERSSSHSRLPTTLATQVEQWRKRPLLELDDYAPSGASTAANGGGSAGEPGNRRH